MSLDEDLQQQKKIVIRRYLSAEALAQVEKGNKFIVVQDDFDLSFVPQGYTLIDMKHKENSFRTLVPQSLLFFMANPGEGDPEGALEEIADFYGDAEDFEEEIMRGGETSVQETNWATLARDNYQIYLINKLVTHKKDSKYKEGESVPEFDKKVLKNLDLKDDYVATRIRAMSALVLGKSSEEVREYNLGDVLKHVTVCENKVEQLTRKEFKEITCWAGSHYEIKPEFRNKDDVEYKIDYIHDKGHKVGIKTIKKRKVAVFDAKISELEEEIERYRLGKHGGNLGRHDRALIRQYANLAYISPENPQAQLDIKPSAKAVGKKQDD